MKCIDGTAMLENNSKMKRLNSFVDNNGTLLIDAPSTVEAKP